MKVLAFQLEDKSLLLSITALGYSNQVNVVRVNKSFHLAYLGEH